MPLPIDARDHPTGNHHLSTPLENGNREPRNRLGPKPAGAPRDLAAASIAQAPEHGKAAGGALRSLAFPTTKKIRAFLPPPTCSGAVSAGRSRPRNRVSRSPLYKLPSSPAFFLTNTSAAAKCEKVCEEAVERKGFRSRLLGVIDRAVL